MLLNVPSSFTALAQGIFTAPGICPPLCACSIGYSGGAVISPENSFGDLTSTSTVSALSIALFTSGKYARIPSSGGCATYFEDFEGGSSFVYSLFSISHFLLPPFMILVFL